jgi:membrane-associated phospholipid phosphatase
MKNFFAFLFLGFSLQINAQNLDINLLKAINQPENEFLDDASVFISKTVTPVNICTPLAFLAVGLAKKDKEIQQKALMMGMTIVVANATSYTIKKIINRPRPFEKYPNDIIQKFPTDTPSFPSGHTTGAFTAATSLTLALPKWYVAVPAYTWATANGLARMRQGVHYPSDILAGAIIGTGTTILTHKINKYLQRKQKR